MSDTELNAVMDKIFDTQNGTQETAPIVEENTDKQGGSTEDAIATEVVETPQEEEPEIEIGERKLKKSELEQILRDNENDKEWKKSNARKSQEIAEEKRQWEAKRAAELADIEAAKEAKKELDKIKLNKDIYDFVKQAVEATPEGADMSAEQISKLVDERVSRIETEKQAERIKNEAIREAQAFQEGLNQKGDAFFDSKLEEIKVLYPDFDVERAKTDELYYKENPFLRSMADSLYAIQMLGEKDPEKALLRAYNTVIANDVDKIAEYKASKKAANMVKNIAGNATKTTTTSTRTAAPSPDPYKNKDLDEVMDAMFDKIKK